MSKKNIVKFEQVGDMIVELRGMQVIIDADVAALYGVETKVVNQAVKNNPEKFPEGYIFTVSEEEIDVLRSKFLTTKINPMTRFLPKAFTEKGLYMLATILKSKRATNTTIAIIEAFAKLRELTRTISELSQTKDQTSQKSLIEKGGDIISEILGDDLKTSETESEFELNFAVLKLRRKVVRKK